MRLTADIYVYMKQQLHYKQPKWLKIQEIYYQHGQNVLSFKTSSNAVFPIGLNYLTYQFEGIKVPELCQVTMGLRAYYEQFIAYQIVHEESTLYSPLSYASFFDSNYQTTIS